jgi:uncharacterized membrane protein YfcA
VKLNFHVVASQYFFSRTSISTFATRPWLFKSEHPQVSDATAFLATNIDLNAQILGLWVVVYFAGIIRGFAGFGSALLAVPALSLIFDPAQAVVIEVLIEIPVSIGLLPVALRGAARRTVLPMLISFLVFVPVGAMLLKTFDPAPMKIFISLVVLSMVGVIALQNRLAAFLTPTGVLLTGVASGITQGMTGIAGPLFATALLARGETAAQTRANIIAVSTGLITLSCLSFWAIGLMTLQLVLYAALASPMMLLGVWTGSVLFARMAHWNLRIFILVILAVTAVITLLQAAG